MEDLKLNSGLKKIAIKNEDDLITVLSVNVADADTAERFGQIIHNLERISDNCEKEAAVYKEEHDTDAAPEDEKLQIEQALEINRIRVKYLKQIADEIDKLFGAGTIQSVYGNITPDEMALVEFIEGVIPIMNKLFGKRYEMTRKRYNSGRKGARA